MTSTYEAIRFGTIVALSSFTLLIEGVIRFIQSVPSQPYHSAGHFDKLKIVCSVLEVAYAGYGIYVGIGAVFFDLNNSHITFFALICMLAFGSVTYCTFTFGELIYNYFKSGFLPSYSNASWTRGEERASLVIGSIFCLCSISICVQGLQFLYTVMLYRIQVFNPMKYSALLHNILCVSFTFFIFLGGAGMLGLGIMASDEFGSEAIKNYFIIFPNYVKYANITVIAGLSLIVYAGVLLAGLFGGKQFLLGINSCCLLCILYFWSAFIMTNIGYFGSGRFSGPAVMLVGLITVYILSPTIIMRDMINMNEDEVQQQQRSQMRSVTL